MTKYSHKGGSGDPTQFQMRDMQRRITRLERTTRRQSKAIRDLENFNRHLIHKYPDIVDVDARRDPFPVRKDYNDASP